MQRTERRVYLIVAIVIVLVLAYAVFGPDPLTLVERTHRAMMLDQGR